MATNGWTPSTAQKAIEHIYDEASCTSGSNEDKKSALEAAVDKSEYASFKTEINAEIVKIGIVIQNLADTQLL